MVTSDFLVPVTFPPTPSSPFYLLYPVFSYGLLVPDTLLRETSVHQGSVFSTFAFLQPCLHLPLCSVSVCVHRRSWKLYLVGRFVDRAPCMTGTLGSLTMAEFRLPLYMLVLGEGFGVIL